jgi:surfeit locus 1 family protein
MLDRRAGLLWPTVFSALGFVFLLGLGTWQLQRMAWKEGLIAQIEQRVVAPPTPFAEVLGRAAKGENLEYTRVRVVGRFIPRQERLLWVAAVTGPGWHVYTPLVSQEGSVVIVNRGYVPDARRDPASRPEPEVSGDVTLVGLLRGPEVKTAFTAENNIARNIWHWRDLDGMAQSMRLDPGRSVAPFFLDAEKGSPAGALGPQGGVTRLEIPNNHLQYVVTWYGLAATLVGVYIAFARARLQRVREETSTAT